MAENKNATITLDEDNIIIPRDVDYPFTFTITKPVFDNEITLNYPMDAASATDERVFTRRVDKSIWKQINSIEVNE